MEIVDANIILRYLLNDNIELSSKAAEIIDSRKIFLLDEVLAEVVYVLDKVYKVGRNEISRNLLNLFKNKSFISRSIEITNSALRFYAEHKIDFIDCILLAYSSQDNIAIFTFDKKLKKLISMRQSQS